MKSRLSLLLPAVLLLAACNSPHPAEDAAEVCACVESVKHSKGFFSGVIRADSCYEAAYMPLRSKYDAAPAKDLSDFKTRVRACAADAGFGVAGSALLKALD